MSTQISCQNSTSHANTAPSYNSQGTQRPAYQVKENDENYTLSVDLPGVSKDAVDVSVENGLLTLKAERSDNIPNDWKLLHSEARNSSYALTLKLGQRIDTNNIQASYENGVLNLTLAKPVEAQARKITLN